MLCHNMLTGAYFCHVNTVYVNTHLSSQVPGLESLRSGQRSKPASLTSPHQQISFNYILLTLQASFSLILLLIKKRLIRRCKNYPNTWIFHCRPTKRYYAIILWTTNMTYVWRSVYVGCCRIYHRHEVAVLNDLSSFSVLFFNWKLVIYKQ